MAEPYIPFGFAPPNLQRFTPQQPTMTGMENMPPPQIPPPAAFGFMPPQVEAAQGGAMPQSSFEAQDLQQQGQGAENMAMMAPFALGGPAARAMSLGSLLFSPAEAQTVDPRQKRIGTIDAKIKEHQTTIRGYADKVFKTKQGRTDATKVEMDAIERLNAERARLQGELDAEFKAAEDLRVAGERGAAWRNTPTAQAYPGVQYGSAGLGGLASAYLAFRGARMPVRQFNERINSLVDRQRTAIGRANDSTLTAAERNQARRTAQAAQTEYDALVASQPHLSWGDRGRAFATSGAATDFGMMLPALADYVYASTQPEGQGLRDYSLHQLNPIENPGRFGVGLLAGGTLGAIGQEAGERFPGVHIPPSLRAETEGLPTRYQSPRKPSKPRARK